MIILVQNTDVQDDRQTDGRGHQATQGVARRPLGTAWAILALPTYKGISILTRVETQVSPRFVIPGTRYQREWALDH